jgi:hypothetical protein
MQQASAKLADEVFTPLDALQQHRLRFNMSDVEVLAGDLDERKLGLKARVCIAGVVYRVFGASCDLYGCNCDAFIVPVGEGAAA